MALTTLHGEAEVRAAVGAHLGYSEWVVIESPQISLFERATGDTEVTYLALSLSNLFLPQIVQVEGFAMGINYGTDAVRLEVGVQAGDRIRGCARLNSVVDVNGGIQTNMLIEITDDAGVTVCTIESLSRWLR